MTQKDVDDYGHDVLDLAQRAALHAMTPELQRIDHQNAELRQQLAAEQRRGLYQSLDSSLPNWKEIDNDPKWRQWLLLSDPLNGRPRQSLLNEAIAAGDATRVLSFFRGFLAEAGQQPQQPQQALSAPLRGYQAVMALIFLILVLLAQARRAFQEIRQVGPFQ